MLAYSPMMIILELFMIRQRDIAETSLDFDIPIEVLDKVVIEPLMIHPLIIVSGVGVCCI